MTEEASPQPGIHGASTHTRHGRMVLAAALPLATLAGLAFALYWFGVAPWIAAESARDEPWVAARIEATPGVAVTLWAKPSHPYLSECHRAVEFENGSWFELPWNTGGRSYINVYAYPDSPDQPSRYLRLLDEHGTYYVDFASRTAGPHISREPMTPRQDGYSLDKQLPESIQRVFAASPGRYLGRLEGGGKEFRFRPAEAATETLIRDKPDQYGRALPVQSD